MTKAPPKHPCLKCKQDTCRVVDSRPVIGDPTVMRRRRYHCSVCGYKWSTHEIPAMTVPGHYTSLQVSAMMFVKEVDKLAREYFGDEDGKYSKSHTIGVINNGK